MRIVNELALYHDNYLNEDNLKKGLDNVQADRRVRKACVMYSEEFIPGVTLND